MRYFRNEGEVVPAETPPMILRANAAPMQIGRNPSFMIDDFVPWEEVDVMTFKLYRAYEGQLLDKASRYVQAGMWVLNEGNDQALRLGSNWPEDGESVDFMTAKDAKIELIKRTQHWFTEGRPKVAHTNSAWSAWIKRIRVKEPFIYLGA